MLDRYTFETSKVLILIVGLKICKAQLNILQIFRVFCCFQGGEDCTWYSFKLRLRQSLPEYISSFSLVKFKPNKNWKEEGLGYHNRRISVCIMCYDKLGNLSLFMSVHITC